MRQAASRGGTPARRRSPKGTRTGRARASRGIVFRCPPAAGNGARRCFRCSLSGHLAYSWRSAAKQRKRLRGMPPRREAALLSSRGGVVGLQQPIRGFLGPCLHIFENLRAWGHLARRPSRQSVHDNTVLLITERLVLFDRPPRRDKSPPRRDMPPLRRPALHVAQSPRRNTGPLPSPLRTPPGRSAPTRGGDAAPRSRFERPRPRAF